MNITKARNNVIEQQIRPWGGLDDVANTALKEVPREYFVPEKYKQLTFADITIPLTDNASMLEPKIEGRLLASLNIQKHETILEIGTGSGYLTAVLSKLGHFVTSIEIDGNLSVEVQKKLDELNIENVNLVVGDVVKDRCFDGHFDVVIITCALPKIAKHYLYLLNTGGRIFAVEGTDKIMSAKLITRVSKYKWEINSLFETQLNMMQGLEPKDSFEF